MIRRRTVCVEEKFIDFRGKNVVASFSVEIIVNFISNFVGMAAQMLLLRDVEKLFADYFFMNFSTFLLFLDGKFVYEVSEKSAREAVIQLFRYFLEISVISDEEVSRLKELMSPILFEGKESKGLTSSNAKSVVSRNATCFSEKDLLEDI